MKFKIINNKYILSILSILLYGISTAQVNHSYPRISHFHFGGAPAEWYAKFDILRGDPNVYEKVKALNPDIITFVSRDWNVWEVRESAPSEWFVRDSEGNKVNIGYGYLMDISEYCPPSAEYGGKKYNEYIVESAIEQCDNPYYDGFFCQGVWEYPRGNNNIDLDRNGLNDWSEHGKDWIRSVWLEGIHKAASNLYQELKSRGKYLILNSGRFHDFEWRNSNGLMLENAGPEVLFPFILDKEKRWKDIAPEPHFLWFDANEAASKNDFRNMRFLLTATLMGDGYFAYTDGGHWYKRYYDEFDTDLGFPRSSAKRLSNNCYVRFFDKGVVIVNTSGSTQIVTDSDLRGFTEYDGPYYRFKGGQDPVFNDGSQFSEISLWGSPTSYGSLGDGIILLKEPLTVVSEIIIDDNDAGTSPGSTEPTFIGDWVREGMNGGDFYYVNVRGWMNLYKYAYSQSGDGQNKAVYEPTIGVSGNYEVFEWHGWIGETPEYIREAKNVPFTIYFSNGAKASGTIDQSINYGQWNSLGTYYFKKGDDNKIVINNKANGVVVADAFKFVYKSDEVDDIPPNAPSSLSSINRTENSITLSWSQPLVASDGDIASAYQVFRDGTLIATPVTNTYKDLDLSENSTYVYSVYAIDNVGNRSSTFVTGTFSTIPDTVPPALVSVGIISKSSIKLVFSEKIEKTSAENVLNYSIEPNIDIYSAVLMDDISTVQLTTGDHTIGNSYTVFVSNIKDLAKIPNTIVPNSHLDYIGGSGDTLFISITVDNSYELYVNGKLVGVSDNLWNAEKYAIPSVGGKNVIAVKAYDMGGAGGLVAEIDYMDKHYVSNENWKISTSEQPGWETISFNDVAWKKATSYGLHGVAMPWAQYRNVDGISTDSNVQWIWSSDNESDDVVYFRFTIGEGGDTSPPSPPSGVTVKIK